MDCISKQTNPINVYFVFKAVILGYGLLVRVPLIQYIMVDTQLTYKMLNY